MSSRPLVSFTFAVLAAFWCIAQPARGQDDFDVPEAAALEPEAGVGDVFGGQTNADLFRQWAFSNVGGVDEARKRMVPRLNLKLDELERVHALSEAQKQKLELAGKGDVKRFFDLVEQTRRKYDALPNSEGLKLWKELEPLQEKYHAGLFDPGSLFVKTIRGAVAPDQAEKYHAVELRHRREHLAATIDWFVAHLDRGIGFSPDQSQKLAELLLARARLPKRFGVDDYNYMLLQASKIPETEIQPLFDDLQWKLVSREIQRGKGMEERLRSLGAIDDEPVVETKTGAAIPTARLIPAAKAKDKEVEKKAEPAASKTTVSPAAKAD